MSVGVVLPKDSLNRWRTRTHPKNGWRARYADTPAVAELMKQRAARMAGPCQKDFSYSASEYAGDRWILAGDAGSFFDPVFSTGVSIAMESGIEAAVGVRSRTRERAIIGAAFAGFSRRQRRATDFAASSIGFYSPEFRDLFLRSEPAGVDLPRGRYGPRWAVGCEPPHPHPQPPLLHDGGHPEGGLAYEQAFPARRRSGISALLSS